MQLIGVAAQIAAANASAKAYEASGEAEAQAKRDQAEAVESKAKDEEIIRLQKLRTVRASQRAYWSAAGIDPATGSPVTVADRSYEMFTLDQGAALINTRSQIRNLNNSADASIRIGKIQARGARMRGIMGAAQNISDSASSWNT